MEVESWGELREEEQVGRYHRGLWNEPFRGKEEFEREPSNGGGGGAGPTVFVEGIGRR